MGLGKTIQCVSMVGVLSELIGHRGPVLVVVPLSTVPNWAKEFKKWTPEVRPGGFKGRAASAGGCTCCSVAAPWLLDVH